MAENYQRVLERTLDEISVQTEGGGKRKRLFLHSCCAPCSSYVLEYLSAYFEITVFYFNPNISPEAEYQYRVEEEKRLIAAMPFSNPVYLFEGDYKPKQFLDAVKGYEKEAEGGERCFRCYELRLRETAVLAQKGGFDYFTTTLSISPLKNAEKINQIGGRLAKEYGVSYLFSDFKKKNGYQRSIILSREYGLYRQNYCGCVFSKQESLLRESGKFDKNQRGNSQK